jgi:molecular chaperone DnaK (HSP70)
MRLGIDFGTTRIVVAFADRGNYPVVSFDVPDGSSSEWYPPLVAVNGSERRYGWEAWASQGEPGWTVIRSIKRALEDAGPETRLQLAEQTVRVFDLLVELASSLKTNLLERSALPASHRDVLEVMLGVPAHANSNQRYLTAESFRQAGFSVLGLLNEPSAASIEFGHRQHAGRRKASAAESSGKQRLLVYDLGGGTFDASLVELDEADHRVIASEGISTLGGDDFDDALAELALDTAAISADERDRLTAAEWFHLHEECRQKKEALHPNTRRLIVDLSQVRAGWPEVSLAATDYFDRCRPLVDETVHAVEDILAAHGYSENGAAASGASSPLLEALYVTGGGSELPLVSRALKEVFGRRVRRSSYTRSATAIGLAIQSDAQAGYRLRDQFTRYFGVWREAEAGREVTFDPLFAKGTPLPGPGDPPVETARRYFPVHNVGHFRYLECTHLTPEGRPTGDITIWDEIRFAFDPALEAARDLSAVAVTHINREPQPEAEERYSADASGAVTVTISNLSAGYSHDFRLGRWSAEETTVAPKPKRGKRRPSAERGSRK